MTDEHNTDGGSDNDGNDGIDELLGPSGDGDPEHQKGTDPDRASPAEGAVGPVGEGDAESDGESESWSLPWSMRDGRRVGAQLGDLVADAMGTFVVNVLLFVTRVVPMTQKMWYGLMNAAYKGLLKTSGGDAIMHVEEEGRLRHKPVKWKTERDGSPMDDPRWVDQDGNWWHSNDGTKSTTLKKQVPTLWASARANELGNSVQAEVAEVLDAGDGKTLTQSAVVNKQVIQMDSDATMGSNGQAMADGGQQAGVQEYVSVDDPGSLKDYLVPLDKALADGDAGRVVSMDKYYETYPSKVAPEKMKEQENFGRLRELSAGEMKSFVLKVLLIAGGIIAAAIMGPSLVEAVLGGGGGGGGGVIPLVSGLLGA